MCTSNREITSARKGELGVRDVFDKFSKALYGIGLNSGQNGVLGQGACVVAKKGTIITLCFPPYELKNLQVYTLHTTKERKTLKNVLESMSTHAKRFGVRVLIK